MYFTFDIDIGGLWTACFAFNQDRQPTGGWGFRLQGACNKVLMLHAVPNVCFSYDLRRGGEADTGRAYDAAFLHHRLHFI